MRLCSTKAGALGLSALAVAGCSTDLTVAPVTPASVAPPGIVYQLPQNQLELVITREIIRCETVGNTYDVAFSLKVDATQQFVPDPSATYSIDYKDLGGMSKATDIVVELYPNGTLKSVNSTLDDQSAQILSKTLSGVINIAKMTLVPGGVLGPGVLQVPRGVRTLELKKNVDPKTKGVDKLPPLCPNSVRTATLQKPKLVASLEKQKSNVVQIEAELAQRRAAVESAKGGTPNEADTIQRLMKRRDAARKDVEETENALAAVNAIVVVAEDKELPRITRNNPTVELLPPSSLLARWFNQEMLPAGDGGSTTKRMLDDDREHVVPTGLILKASLTTVPLEGKAQTPADPPLTTKGLVYRMPARGRLTVCRSDLCGNGKGGVLLDAMYDAPQLGVYGILPLHNGMFATNTLTADFTSAGAPIKVSYKTNATGDGAASAFNDATKQALDFRKERASAPVDQTKAQVDLIEQQVKLLDAQKKLREAQNALDSLQ